jgi:hypothetical protein
MAARIARLILAVLNRPHLNCFAIVLPFGLGGEITLIVLPT